MVSSLLHLSGATGTVMFDEKADRDPDFVISSYTQGDDTYHEWTQILMYRQENQVSQIRIGLHYTTVFFTEFNELQTIKHLLIDRTHF